MAPDSRDERLGVDIYSCWHSKGNRPRYSREIRKIGLGSVSRPRCGVLRGTEQWVEVDLLFDLQRSNLWDHRLSSIDVFSAAGACSGSALPWLPQTPRFHDCAVSPPILKTSVAHPQTFSPAIRSTNMATVNHTFACQRQQCSYGTDLVAHMESHIVHKHFAVKPWKCAQPTCNATCARK